MTSILILGKNGQVGHELCGCLAGLGTISALGRAELDLSDLDAIRSTIRRLRPQLIVNAAAFTAVDEAETSPEQAMVINRDAPRILAEETKKLQSTLIHYSTDYVFDGAQSTPYTETNAANPINAYGASKLAGERAIVASGAMHLILRTSWVYSDRGKNFVTMISNLARMGKELKVVNDQTGSPTWARTIARTTRLIIEKCGGSLADKQGTYHLAAAGETTRHELAAKIVELLARDPNSDGVTPANVKAVSSAEFPTVAARPKYSVLSSAKLKTLFGIEMPRWDADLERFFSQAPGSRLNSAQFNKFRDT